MVSTLQKWLSLKWRHTLHMLFLLLMLKSLGLITLVPVLSKIERLLKKGTRAFELLLTMIFIFLPGIVPNLFSNQPKTISLIESAKTLLFLILPVTGILPKISLPTLPLPLSLLSLTRTAVLPSLLSLKLNSFLKPSVITPSWTILGIFLLLISPQTHLWLIKILPNEVFYALSGLNSQKAYGADGVPPIVLKTCASVLTPCLVKLFCLSPSTSTFPSCRKYAYVQPVPKKGDRSNPSNYRPIALLSCLSKSFESIFNQKIQKHLSTSDLISDRQYGFHKWRSTGDLLSLLIDSWSFSLSRFGETFSVALDLSKAFVEIESGISLYFLNCPLSVSIPLSVI